jgi:arylsulfatase A-like enzyme
MRRSWLAGTLGLIALGLAARFGFAHLTERRVATVRSAAVHPKIPLVESSAPAPVADPAPKAEPPYSVLLIMIDSLRADMPWTGYRRAIAPWLTKFAERATLYPRAYSMSSYTAKSVAPTLAGKYPSEMKRDGYFYTHWFDENVFISERAQKHGIRTLAGNGHGYFLPQYGLKQGWDDYRLLEGTAVDFTGVADVNSDRLNNLAKKMLSDPKNVDPSGDKPFFAYFHFLDPHFTYIKHDEDPDYGDERRDLYDNEVHFTDRWVGDLVDWALEQPFGKRLAVIVTADHGEGMGERGHYRHAYQVWESLVRVPLFIHVPGAPPRRIETPRGAIDLAPTIADLLGIPHDDLRGKSLLPEVFGADPKPRPIIVDLPRCDLMDSRRALIDGDYKLVVFGDETNFYLFNVAKDFKETQNLAKTEPEKLEQMKTRYAQISSSIEIRPVVGDAPLLGAPAHQRY